MAEGKTRQSVRPYLDTMRHSQAMSFHVSDLLENHVEANATAISHRGLDRMAKDSRLRELSRNEVMHSLIDYLWLVHDIKWPERVLQEDRL